MPKITITMDVEESVLARIDEAAERERISRDAFFLLAATARAIPMAGAAPQPITLADMVNAPKGGGK